MNQVDNDNLDMLMEIVYREMGVKEPEEPNTEVPMPRTPPPSPTACACKAGTCPRSVLQECGHEVLIPCPALHKPVKVSCQTLVEPKNPSSCGHPVLVPCNLKDELIPNAVAKYCREMCGTVFPKEENGCGHVCPGTCVLCRQGRFHCRCENPCGRILVCNHVCTEPCSLACPPCTARCERGCEHGPCQETCGFPCEPCQEPCTWECPHQKCTKKCGEICDRPTCDEPCPKTLPCGHPCISFCGDPCPTLCGTCDKERLEAGLILSKDAVEETDRFVLLQDCGHAIEHKVLECWMSVQDCEGEIYPKTCPLCKRTIYKCRRYNAAVHRTRVDAYRVQRKTFGDPVGILQLQDQFIGLMNSGAARGMIRLQDLWKYLRGYIPEKGKSLRFGDLSYTKLNYQKIKSLVHITKIWFDIELKLDDLVVDGLMEVHIGVLVRCYIRLFAEIIELVLPLRGFEYRDLHRQLERFHDLSQLYQRRSFKLNPGAYLCRASGPRKVFMKCQDLAWLWKPYDEDLKAQFRVALRELDGMLNCTLRITDEERRSILQAVGLCSGRWFKCPNGHIYLVTECGGATQVSNCNECGLKIGGDNHRILEGNKLATEMDGALTPAYPGAAGNQ